MSTEELKLNDECIAMIAKTLQLAILTGTDIVDNLRLIRFIQDGDQLLLSEKFKSDFENGLSKLQDDLKNQNNDVIEKEESGFGGNLFT